MSLLVGQDRLRNPEAESPNPLRAFRIEVNADSMIQMNEGQEKQDRMEFLTANGGFMKQAMEMVAASLGVAVKGERQPTNPGFVQRPVAAEPNHRSIVLAVAAGRRLGPTPALFLKLIRARNWGGHAEPAVEQAA